MHRTQIYFEERMFERIRQRASSLGVSISAYIRETLKRDLEAYGDENEWKKISQFAGMWKDRDDITVESLREKAWK